MTDTPEKARRLEELKAATEKWGAVKKKQYEDAVFLSQTILKGRTGLSSLTSTRQSQIEQLAVEELNEFLNE